MINVDGITIVTFWWHDWFVSTCDYMYRMSTCSGMQIFTEVKYSKVIHTIWQWTGWRLSTHASLKHVLFSDSISNRESTRLLLRIERTPGSTCQCKILYTVSVYEKKHLIPAPFHTSIPSTQFQVRQYSLVIYLILMRTIGFQVLSPLF